jgi:hypothetical protein
MISLLFKKHVTNEKDIFEEKIITMK